MLNKKNNIIERALNGICHCLVEKKLYVPMCPSTNLLWSNDEIGKAIGRLALTRHSSQIMDKRTVTEKCRNTVTINCTEQVERNDVDDLMMRAMTSHTDKHVQPVSCRERDNTKEKSEDVNGRGYAE